MSKWKRCKRHSREKVSECRKVITYDCILDGTRMVMGRKVGRGGQRTPNMFTILQRAMTHCLEAVLSMMMPRKRALAA